MSLSELVARISFTVIIFGTTVHVHSHENHSSPDVMDRLYKEFESEGSRHIQDFESSNLPIVIIDTEGTEIPDEPKIHALMKIVYNGPGIRNFLTGPFNHYDGHIGIELRGNTTQYFPKKPYNIETRDAQGENLNIPLLGLPEENDWVLRSAFMDKTLIRDPLALWMARSLGNYASRTVHVELVLNGEYQGIYILAEKVKPDRNRVNITKMDPEDISGDEVTGGYIYEIAKGWVPVNENLSRTEGDNRRIKYPKASLITDEQRAYIAKYDDDFRSLMEQADFADSLSGYSKWIDVPSFIDEILVQEATRNSDAYGWSSHFHKDRLGKLRAGPAWDFDQALANSTFLNGQRYEDWLVDQTSIEIWSWGGPYPQFWLRLFYEPAFRNQLITRWFEMREGSWSTPSLMNVIDSMAHHLNEAQARNFERWPILGVEIWRSVPGWWERDTYEKEVGYLKSYLTNRMNWIDEQLHEAPQSGNTLYQNFPNPFNTTTTLKFVLAKPGYISITVYDLQGRAITQLVSQPMGVGIHSKIWNGKNNAGSKMPSGIYFARLHSTGLIKNIKMILLK